MKPTFYRTITGFIKKELVQALRDPRMRIMLLITPMIQMSIFGLALNTDMKNIKLSTRYYANDPLLRDVHRDAIASGWFLKAPSDPGIQAEGLTDFRKGDAEVALYAPEGGLTQWFENGRGRLEAVIDGSNLVRARAINGYLYNIFNRAAATRAGMPYSTDFAETADVERGSSPRLPIFFNIKTLYNPEQRTPYNLVPGVLCMLMCITTIMLTSMSIAKEKEMGTFETLISAPISVGEILLGKTIPFIIIGCINLPLVFGVAVVGFEVPMRGPYVWLALSTLFFLISTVAIGTLISTVSRTQQQAMMGSFIFLLPAILLSGVMFPLDDMPLILKGAAHLNPLMYFSVLLRNIMLKGGDHLVVLTYTGALALIAAACTSIAFKRFKLHLG